MSWTVEHCHLNNYLCSLNTFSHTSSINYWSKYVIGTGANELRMCCVNYSSTKRTRNLRRVGVKVQTAQAGVR